MSKQKILIVDDSKAMRLIVRRTLRQAGFDGLEINEATNGQEALDALLVGAPDLVLSDWNMPEMTGIELLEQLKVRGINVRFGFITTEGTPDMRAAANAAGALFLIAKPFTPEILRSTLSPHLSSAS
jgi:two-component system, chemotaxis family, chemotaxis protein CheY